MTRGPRRRPEGRDPAELLEESRRVLPRDVRAAARLAVAAIRAARERGDDERELRGYWALSNAAVLDRRPRFVLAVVEKALACRAARDDSPLRARTLLLRGAALIHFGRWEQVRAEAGLALELLRATKDCLGLATAHQLLATIALTSRRPAEAIEHSVLQRRALGSGASPFALATSEEAEAMCRVQLFEFVEALRLFESARERFESVGFAGEAARARLNCAYLYVRSGRYADALRLYACLADEFERNGSEALLRALCVDRAELLLEIGATGEARRWTARALASGRDRLSEQDRLRTRLLLAVAALQERDAESAFEEASKLAVEFDGRQDFSGAAESLVVTSTAALSLGLADEALETASRARRFFESSAGDANARDADFAYCRAALATGDVAAASRALDDAVSRAGASTLPWLALETFRHRAMVVAARGDDAAAADLLDYAVRELETRRGLLPPDALRSAFLSLHAPLYREAVATSLRLGRIERAFELATAAKSRALLDLMASGARADPADAPVLDRLRTELGGAYARLQAASNRGAPETELAAILDDASRIERQAAEIVEQSLNRSADGTAARPPQSAADLRSSLDEDEALVEYSFAADALHAFVVTRRGVRHVALEVRPADLVRFLRKFSFHIAMATIEPETASTTAAVAAVRSNLAELRRALVDPLGLCAASRRVVIAPDGLLTAVPFHAFASDAGWWADEVLVTYAPSAMVHAACRRGSAGAAERVYVLAAPDEAAPEIAAEARCVAAALGPEVTLRIGEDASWASFVEAATSARLMHVATHGVARTDTVVGGSIRLADGWVTPLDLYRLRVRADLVVLSACESGASRFDAAGEQFGLIRGFLCAGASRVIAGLWRVDDRTTMEWMTVFYGALSRHRSVGDAYQEASRTIRQASPNPRSWAAFALTGEPARQVFSK